MRRLEVWPLPPSQQPQPPPPQPGDALRSMLERLEAGQELLDGSEAGSSEEDEQGEQDGGVLALVAEQRRLLGRAALIEEPAGGGGGMRGYGERAVDTAEQPSPRRVAPAPPSRGTAVQTRSQLLREMHMSLPPYPPPKKRPDPWTTHDGFTRVRSL